MAIKKDFLYERADGVNIYRVYSNKNVYIRQTETGLQDIEMFDIENAPYTYTETDIPVEAEKQSPEPKAETDLTVSDTLEMLGELGVDVSD